MTEAVKERGGEFQRETKGKSERVSLCLTVYMLFTRGDSSRYQERHMKSKAYTV